MAWVTVASNNYTSALKYASMFRFFSQFYFKCNLVLSSKFNRTSKYCSKTGIEPLVCGASESRECCQAKNTSISLKTIFKDRKQNVFDFYVKTIFSTKDIEKLSNLNLFYLKILKLKFYLKICSSEEIKCVLRHYIQL